MFKKGQSIIEYAVVITVVVAVLLSMRVYYKRSVMGKVRGYAEQIGSGMGYSPRATVANSLIKRTITENGTSYSQDGTGEGFKNSISETNTSIIQSTTKTEEVSAYGNEKNI